MSENRMIQPSNADQPNNPKPGKKRDIKTIVMIVVAAQVVLAVLLGVFLFKRSYENGKNNTSDRIRKEAYNTVYEATEQANHVSNRVTVSLEGIREKADLEVLQVESSYIYVSEKGSDKIWYSIPGAGSFTIDMRMAEFIVDENRHQVHVIAPPPAITKFDERVEDIQELFYKNNRFIGNGSVQEGTQIAQQMMYKAHNQMVKDLELNWSYFQAAEDSAARLIINTIKALNPSIPDIKVIVEFKNGSVR